MGPESSRDGLDRSHDERGLLLLLEAIERGEAIDPRAFLDEHPRCSDEVRRALRGLPRYIELLGCLRGGVRPPALLPLDRIGDYEIVALEARGGMAEVYRARQLSLGERPVALKVLDRAQVTESDWRRFHREARLAARFDHHPNMVAIHDLGEDEDRGLLYYTMRLVDGVTLKKALEDLSDAGGVPESSTGRRIVERVRDVARALASLHESGLVHGDVKPSNIMLEGTGGEDPLACKGVLVDFGLVREFDGTVSTLLGTPPYAPPEVLRGGAVGPHSDVFSVGVTLHDLLSASRPADRDAQRLPPLRSVVSWIGADLEAIVAKATDPDPGHRYSDGGELLEDLEAYLRGAPVRARTLRGVERARRWARRNPGRVLGGLVRFAGVAVVLLAAIAAGSVVWGIASSSLSARRAHQEGDIQSLIWGMEGVPATLRRFLLPDSLVGSARPDEAIAHVLEAWRVEGVLAGALSASAYLQEGGYASNAFLLRVLQHGVGGSHRATWMPVVARMFFERPVATRSDLEATRELRGEIVNLLHEVRGELALHAVAALGAMGSMTEIDTILAWLGEPPGSRNAVNVERRRLAWNSIELLLRRSRACGYEARIDRSLLDRILQGVQRGEGGTGPSREAAERLCRIEALLRRRLGEGPSGKNAPFAGRLMIDAARGDREFGTRLATLMQDDVFLSRGNLSTLGEMLACFDDPRLTESALREILARFDPRDNAKNTQLLQHGLEWPERVFTPSDYSVDPRDRMRSVSGVEPVTYVPIEEGWNPLSPVDDESLVLGRGRFKLRRLACWFFEGHSFQCHEGALRVGLRAARLEEDPNGSRVILGIPGGSEVHLIFEGELTGGEQPFLRLSLIKGLRRGLPYRGRRGVLSIHVDGERMGEVPSLHGSAHPAEVALPAWSGLRQVSIVLRLEAASDTTVYLLDARVLATEIP